MTLILCRESIVNLRILWTLGALYILLKFIFFENVNFSVASLMTILGESTMKQSGNMFLEIKNQERRNKGTS